MQNKNNAVLCKVLWEALLKSTARARSSLIVPFGLNVNKALCILRRDSGLAVPADWQGAPNTRFACNARAWADCLHRLSLF